MSDILFVEYTPDWRDNFPGKKANFKKSVAGWGESRSNYTKARQAAMEDLMENLADIGANVFVVTSARLVIDIQQHIISVVMPTLLKMMLETVISKKAPFRGLFCGGSMLLPLNAGQSTSRCRPLGGEQRSICRSLGFGR